MTVPAEAALDVVAGLGGISTDYIFDRAGCDVTVVRCACGEGRSIVECIRWEMFSPMKLLLKSIDGLPIPQYLLLLLRKRNLLRCYINPLLRYLNAAC